MKKTSSKIKINENQMRVIVRLESPPTPIDGAEGIWNKINLLSSIVNDPSLIHCELQPFEKLKMFHDGEKWMVEAEAIINT